jgi:hypothetical protein
VESPDRPQGNEQAKAESAFAEFLRLRSEGKAPDFRAFCAERPEIADALEILHSLHVRESTLDVNADFFVPVTF